jgi:CBS domain-containing protein
MNKNNIGSVIVVKEYTTEPVGIITERDIVRIIGSSSHPFCIYPYGN